MALSGDPVQAKSLAVQVEDLPDYGRLLDIDVYDTDGRQLSRAMLGLPLRTCFLCAEDAITCMRQGRHSSETLHQEFLKRMAAFAADNNNPWPTAVWDISHWAIEAMLMEASCTPAPGLVDRKNSGAHNDMDFFTFMTSTSALGSTMARCAAAGWHHTGLASDLLPQLRRIGCDGERKMFHSTQGVNTQKGLIFLMGLLCASAGMLRRQNLFMTAEAICDGVAALSIGIVQRELEPLLVTPPSRVVTAGEKLFLNHRITGIRGEAQLGLPSALQLGLPCLRQSLSAGLSLNDALVQTLLKLMTTVEDTTILTRHNLATLREVQQKAVEILELGGMFSAEGRLAVMHLDTEFIQRWISPGGVADLLAAVYFLHVAEIRSRLDLSMS
jgi:holo-ACP synthase/triphosphoribosyl-dephospho-CoA synthase